MKTKIEEHTKAVLIYGITAVFIWNYLVQNFPTSSTTSQSSAWLNFLLATLTLLATISIKSKHGKVIGAAWIGWLVIGTTNAIASNYFLGKFYSQLDIGLASQIFLGGALAFLLGIMISEMKSRTPEPTKPLNNINLISKMGLITFPFAWIISLYVSVGYIPILQGTEITDSMYTINYGPLYGLGAVIILSILYSWNKYMDSYKKSTKTIYLILTITFIAFSLADGKRAFALVSMVGMLSISLRHKPRMPIKQLTGLVFVVFLLYTITLIMRSGGSENLGLNLIRLLTLVGVEFRDFSYTITHYGPGEIHGYSWTSSAAGALINGNILQVLGFSKQELVSQDSARAWALIWNSELGIRTGIISELWFAFGYSYLLLMMAFGVIAGIIIRRILNSGTTRGLIFLSAIYGLIALSIMGQSTFTLGVLPVLLYAYIGIVFIDAVTRAAIKTRHP